MTIQTQDPTQRLGRRYYFNDSDMDLFFVGALSYGPAGGLEIGQAFYVASQIEDGNPDSWVEAFTNYGAALDAQADAWLERGWTQAAGEMRLKAAASYRSAWQFSEAGAPFLSIYVKERAAFARSMTELKLPVTSFDVPYGASYLPGMFVQNPNRQAPVILIIGGADTGFQDLFLSYGRKLYERGYSVAIADLPGQGDRAGSGLHWEVQSELSIGAITDVLVNRFGAVPGKMALMGVSLGGYFVTRAAGYETRFAAVIASTPFPNPGEMFARATEAGKVAAFAGDAVSQAAQRGRKILAWKAGATTPEELVAKTSAMVADPTLVTQPFLSVVGGGESPIFLKQARDWHNAIRSERKDFVTLDAATGADGHCQVNNRLRLVQEVDGWLSEVLS